MTVDAWCASMAHLLSPMQPNLMAEIWARCICRRRYGKDLQSVIAASWSALTQKKG